MNKLHPINLDNGTIQIHPLRLSDIEKQEQIIDNYLEILSDIENTQYIPEKRTNDREQVSMNLFGITYRYGQELGYTHLITLKEENEVVGQINVISPKGVKVETKYEIEDSWFIEYCLNKKVWGYGIMSGILRAVIAEMVDQGIENISALCMSENIASIRTLEKSGFIKLRKFDLKQDLYKFQNL